MDTLFQGHISGPFHKMWNVGKINVCNGPFIREMAMALLGYFSNLFSIPSPCDMSSRLKTVKWVKLHYSLIFLFLRSKASLKSEVKKEKIYVTHFVDPRHPRGEDKDRCLFDNGKEKLVTLKKYQVACSLCGIKCSKQDFPFLCCL